MPIKRICGVNNDLHTLKPFNPGFIGYNNYKSRTFDVCHNYFKITR